MKSAIDLLRDALREMGAEGLCNGSCACALDDLAGCLGPCNSCVPAKRGPVPIRALPLFELKLKGVCFALRDPILLDVAYENELYICTNDDLGLFVIDKNLKEVAEGINEEMEMLWDIYVKANVSDLSGDAIKLRNKISSMFEEEDINDILWTKNRGLDGDLHRHGPRRTRD